MSRFQSRRGLVVVAGLLLVPAGLTLAYLRWGLALQAPQQLLQLVPVLIGGALLGRGAMWATVAWLVVLVAVGGWRDATVFMHRPQQLVLVGSRVIGSIAGFGLTGLPALVLCAALGGWFPLDNIGAWVSFVAIYLVTLAAITAGYTIYYRRTAGSFDAALARYREGRKE